jgi:hypothetical protein
MFFSCEKTISIEIPDEGRKITVNSLFSANSTLLLNLTKSRHILDGKWEFESVTDADITLFENDELIEKLGGEQGYYYSSARLSTDKNYRIEISSKGFPDVKAESSIPKPIKIDDFTMAQSTNEYGNPVNVFNLQFQDNPTTENYYYIELYVRTYYEYFDENNPDASTISYETSLYLQSDDLNVIPNNWGMSQGLLLNDELINGRKYNLTFTSPIDNSNMSGDNIGEKISSTYFVYFHSTSKAYYLYNKSLSKQQESTDDIFMEPVQVYSNVENGFGIFAGMSADVDSIKVMPSM